MEYTIEKNLIRVKNDEFFNPIDTVTCGQLFRYKVDGENVTVFSKDKMVKIVKTDSGYDIFTNDPKYFVNYLDFDRNYGIIYTKLIDKGLVVQCCEYSKGIRILNQDLVETIISFIISANNNIPRIQKIIERLSKEIGENMGEYYAFPTLDALCSEGEEFYKSIGAGYRAKYLVETSRKLRELDIESWRELPTEALLKNLSGLMGVGPKVADCIALFGYHKEDVCPVDTWIKKVYNTYFGSSNDPKQIRKELTNRFGNLSGYMQQYLFFYQRELDK